MTTISLLEATKLNTLVHKATRRGLLVTRESTPELFDALTQAGHEPCAGTHILSSHFSAPALGKVLTAQMVSQLDRTLRAVDANPEYLFALDTTVREYYYQEPEQDTSLPELARLIGDYAETLGAEELAGRQFVALFQNLLVKELATWA